ncbi:MAG: O-antigen ligase family protein [Bryobacteraceae bacterium]
MTASEAMKRASLYLTMGSLAAALFSIAICHAMLALSVAALLASGEKLRLPPIKLPLILFMALTLVSLALSDDPAAGRPQIRKFFVFLTLLVVSSCVRDLFQMRALVLIWSAVATLSSTYALAQFQRKVEGARAGGYDFYQFYVADRITGFMGHWMTFAGEMMIVLLLLAALLLFGGRVGYRWALAGGGVLIAAAIVLSFTRSVWPGVAAGGIYLLWHWRRRALLALPVLAAVCFLAAPASLRTRVVSAFQPNGQLDSNQHREVLRATGWRMIRAHPLFGVGPMMVKEKFLEFIPPDAPRPVPNAWWYEHLHNTYVHYAAERGVPAALALLWLMGKALWDFARAAPVVREGAFIVRGAIAVILGVLVGGLWEVNLGDSEVLGMFLATVSCGYTAIEAERG